MTREAPAYRAKPPGVWIATRGTIIGFFVAFTLLSVTLKQVFGTDFDWDIPAWLIGWGLGGTIGGLIQLRREGRSVESGKLVAQQLGMVAVALPVFLAAWLGAKFYGGLGWWAGLLGSAGLTMLALWLIRGRSRQGATPPG